MKNGSLIVNKKEYVYIKKILNITSYAQDLQTKKSLQRLIDELKNAQIVNDDEMPKDVIRFDSKIMVRSETGWEKSIQLVIPSNKDAKQDKVSILTPMGAALFGYAEGDKIEWEFPSGPQVLQIISVVQDENQKKAEIQI